MSESPVFLIINATPNPDKMEKFMEYNSKIGPIFVGGGAEVVGRFKVAEQIKGEGGPKAVAIFKFASKAVIETLMTSEAFTALAELRAEVFLKLDIMISNEM